eukprot:789037-Pyramimonas_sp.AAC.1
MVRSDRANIREAYHDDLRRHVQFYAGRTGELHLRRCTGNTLLFQFPCKSDAFEARDAGDTTGCKLLWLKAQQCHDACLASL